MNGIHSELNGGGENMALKDEVQHLQWLILFWVLGVLAGEMFVLVNVSMLMS